MRPFWKFVSLFGIYLMLNNLTFENRVMGELVTWRIERLTAASNAKLQIGFEKYDAAIVFLDAPSGRFPLELKEVIINWQKQVALPTKAVVARILMYNGQGILRYTYEYALLLPGKNTIQLAVECNQCRAMFYADDGPGMYLGVQYLGEMEYISDDEFADITPWSGHIVSAADGVWPDYNLFYDASANEFLDGTSLFAGNLSIRGRWQELCRRAADIDGDFDIDLEDLAYIESCLSGPDVDVFHTACKYCDLDNDDDVDDDDVALAVEMMTGPNVPVQCASIEVLPTEINQSSFVESNPENNRFSVINTGAGSFNFWITDDADWLTVTPATGVANEQATEINLSYNLTGLPAGMYHAAVTIEGSAINSPKTLPVTIALFYPGDLDFDNDVDFQDLDLFEDCASGPGVASNDSEICQFTDLDYDGDVDQADFALIQPWISGPLLLNNPIQSISKTIITSASIDDLGNYPLVIIKPNPNRVQPMYTWSEVGIALSIIGILCVSLQPTISYLARKSHHVSWSADGQRLDDGEEALRVKWAIEWLGTLQGQEAQEAFWRLAPYQDPALEKIKVNRVCSEDDLDPIGTHIGGVVTVHYTYITGNRWQLWNSWSPPRPIGFPETKRDPNNLAVKALGLILWGEAYHLEHPGLSEEQVQTAMDRLRSQNNLNHIAAELTHHD
jgi:hypothetical protein